MNPELHLGESFYIDYIYTPVVITATFKGRMGHRNKRKEAREGKNISYFNWVLQKKPYPECNSKKQLILSFISVVHS